MKIRPVEVVFRADGRTDRHDEANNRFSNFENVPQNSVFTAQ
jgi:hypothetical protein